jgi:YVTN family beta-propeller protein
MNTSIRVAAVGLVLLVVGCGGSRSMGQNGNPRELIYVTNQAGASVSAIDVERQEVVATIDLQALGFSDTAKPHHIAVEPDGEFWYVTLIGESRILKFNRDNELVASAEFEVPGMLSLDPDSDLLFVARSMTAVNPPTRIGIIERDDMSVEEVDVFFPRPHAIAISRDGETIYTASLAENKIMAINVDTEQSKLITLDGPERSLVQFAVSPDGNTLVAGGHLDAKFAFFDISDPLNPTLKGQVSVNHGPWDPVFTPDGRFVYFGNKMHNSITVVDASDIAIKTVIEDPGLAEPGGSAISADGRFVFISNENTGGENGSVVVIDTSTNTIVKTIPVGKGPTGMGTRPR